MLLWLGMWGGALLSLAVGLVLLFLLFAFYERRYPYVPGPYRIHSLRNVPATETARPGKVPTSVQPQQTGEQRQNKTEIKYGSSAFDDKTLSALRLSDLFVHKKVIVIGSLPGEGDGFAARLAKLLDVPYLHISNLHLLLEPKEGSDAGIQVITDIAKVKQLKGGYPTQVNHIIRDFFRRKKFSGWVVDLVLDKWEVSDILLEDGWELIWLEYPLHEKFKHLFCKIVKKKILFSPEKMFPEEEKENEEKEETEKEENGISQKTSRTQEKEISSSSLQTTKKQELQQQQKPMMDYTRYWYSWKNLLCFWDENRSLVARLFRHHFKDQAAVPYLWEKHPQLNLWTFASKTDADEFLAALEIVVKHE
jgi:hypothetical protein